MSGGFNNPLVGGGGALVYPSIHSPNFVHGISGWTINKDGSAEFNNVIIRNGQVISGTSLYYSGPPALGNLIASISPNGGVDDFGNVYQPGVVSYQPGVSLAQLFQGQLEFKSLAVTSRIIQAATLALNDAVADPAQPGLTMVAPSTGVGSPVGAVILKGQSKDATKPAQVLVAPAANPVPATSVLLEVQGTGQLTAAAAAGQVLTIQDTTGTPANSIVEIIAAAAADNALGVMVNGDTFNRWKLSTAALLAGTGAATQDTRIYRSNVAEWSADTIKANIAGSAETWHSLGTLTGAAVNIARYRLMPDGLVHIEIDVTFGVATAAGTITFSNTLPVAYRPLSTDVDVRRPTSQTNGAAVIARIFIGQQGGAAPGQVQLANLGAGNYLGTYSAEANYAVI